MPRYVSPFVSTFELDALAAQGRTDDALTLLKRTWGHMLARRRDRHLLGEHLARRRTAARLLHLLLARLGGRADLVPDEHGARRDAERAGLQRGDDRAARAERAELGAGPRADAAGGDRRRLEEGPRRPRDGRRQRSGRREVHGHEPAGAQQRSAAKTGTTTTTLEATR